jgi:putative glutamine amidotransferase
MVGSDGGEADHTTGRARDGGPSGGRPPKARAPRTPAVAAAGGLPLIVRPGETDIDALLAAAHGVVITGGAFDIHPRWYGQAPQGRLDAVDEGRTSTEIALARACLDRGIPILGICGGMQALVVAAGGTLIQDLPGADDTHLAHEQPTDPATPWHPVRIDPPGDRWLGVLVDANSTHHQAVDDPGALIACGWASDGVVEVVTAPDHPFALGVQWHPEIQGDGRAYAALVRAAARLTG